MKKGLSCSACGGNNFQLDQWVTDQTVIACQECGNEMGTLGKLKQDAERLSDISETASAQRLV